jgi:maltose alpha-D-glucosyltransferase/alpha-amylase
VTPTPGRGGSLWYKDAIIYELHVKTFFDANGDGIGDFAGLTQKLDYFADLGVTCLWLLPFYESPLRDDGYDVSHYERVHPSYGTLDDFKTFVDGAHARGLKVIAELVINHTSDRHPWFEAARRAPAGSAKRDFYVWSDTDSRYADARIIFGDVERSNWTWDPVAGAFYWHRFFSHQPDLNFDNPRVRRAMLKAARFWLDLGVDGLRLDAVAHLFEREGTSCENLPETHAFLKQFRAALDARYADRVLLAEVNTWPADVRPYFGEGDECHMAFHFPLMPRLFIALKQGLAWPVVDIIQRTHELPEPCQWALFLRNHDELTLSTVTDDERDFLYAVYAADPEMRLNHGIRRRLAPLFDNDRDRIDLAFALLLSLPGTPVIYYGDELGMGDNVSLGDRDGVRTPMQWNDDAAAGFSRRPSDRLVLPVIENGAYDYRRINASRQQADPESLWSCLRRLIAVRRQHRAFGRGSITFLDVGNPHVLAFERWDGDDRVLVVANLSASPQAAVVPMAPGSRSTAVHELVTDAVLPPCHGAPYAVALPGLGYFWLRLTPLTAPLPRTVAVTEPTGR